MMVRIGVIGTGVIGRDHARRINQVLADGAIVALSDVNHASAEAVKSASDACIEAQSRSGAAVPITLPARPALYN